MSKLTEILDQYSIVRYDNINGINAASETDGYELQKDILAWVAEVIGDIEPDPDKKARNADLRRQGRNQLRAEQRKRARL